MGYRIRYDAGRAEQKWRWVVWGLGLGWLMVTFREAADSEAWAELSRSMGAGEGLYQAMARFCGRLLDG